MLLSTALPAWVCGTSSRGERVCKGLSHCICTISWLGLPHRTNVIGCSPCAPSFSDPKCSLFVTHPSSQVTTHYPGCHSPTRQAIQVPPQRWNGRLPKSCATSQWLIREPQPICNSRFQLKGLVTSNPSLLSLTPYCFFPNPFLPHFSISGFATRASSAPHSYFIPLSLLPHSLAQSRSPEIIPPLSLTNSLSI